MNENSAESYLEVDNPGFRAGLAASHERLIETLRQAIPKVAQVVAEKKRSLELDAKLSKAFVKDALGAGIDVPSHYDMIDKVMFVLDVIERDPVGFPFKYDYVIQAAMAWQERHRAIDRIRKATTADKNISGPPEEAQLDSATEARDKWIYNECVKGTLHSTVVAKLEGKPKSWGRIETVQGIKGAAERYAKRHNLALPPKRTRGRRAKNKLN